MTEKELEFEDELDLEAILAEFSQPEEDVQENPEPVARKNTIQEPKPARKGKPIIPSSNDVREKTPKLPRQGREPAQKKQKAQKAPAERKAQPKRKPRNTAVWLAVLGGIGKLVLGIVCVAMAAATVLGLCLIAGPNASSVQGKADDVTIMDKYDMFMTNEISNALDGILKIEKVYWLSDNDQVAPKPDEKNFGYTENIQDLDAVLRNARPLTGSRELVFNLDRSIKKGSGINFYYDETILVITWKELLNDSVYTISEVVIAHPSQFRRFLAGGEFGSDKQYLSTEMAKSVNAVVASSGDFYKFRRNGIVVYKNKVQRYENRSVDTCYIDGNGDLLFSRINEIESEEAAQKFVDDNNIRFSLCFGPILIDNGVPCPPKGYIVGEIKGHYSRMALCQKGDLHYLLVNATGEPGVTTKRPDIFEFTDVINSFGVDKAYALDGGQTTVISMRGQAINRVEFGYERQISDIIYFATALPNGE